MTKVPRLHPLVFFLGLAIAAVAAFFCFPRKTSTHFFQQATGYAVPAAAEVIEVGNSHGGFFGDGESWLVMSVENKVINRWEDSPPSWAGPRWTKGPVPYSIWSHCTFGKPGRESLGLSDEGLMFGDPEVHSVMSSNDIKYVARERNEGWHNGDLAVLVPRASEVWFASWDN